MKFLDGFFCALNAMCAVAAYTNDSPIRRTCNVAAAVFLAWIGTRQEHRGEQFPPATPKEPR